MSILIFFKPEIYDTYYSLYYTKNEYYCSNLEYEQLIIKGAFPNGKVMIDNKIKLIMIKDNEIVKRFTYEKCI